MENGTPNTSSRASGEAEDQSLESLLSHASARPAPPAADRRAVERTVREEWRRVTAGRRWRRRAIGLSAAAAVVLVVTLMLVGGDRQAPGPELREMARVEKVTGRVRVLAGDADGDGTALADRMPVFVGQTLRTGRASGIALLLEGGISLRVDEDSELALIGERAASLESGRVYVDTGSDAPGDSSAAASARFELLTVRGAVRHLGTQYMVRVGGERLNVSVRQGAVQVFADEDDVAALLVSDGQELTVGEGGERELAPTDIHGEQWRWAEALGPGYELDGRTMAEFLAWVAAETGLQLVYKSDAAEISAEQTVLHGTVDLPAREALDVVLLSSDLSAEIGEGAIEISVRP